MTQHIQTKDRVTRIPRTPLHTGGELMCSVRVSSSSRLKIHLAFEIEVGEWCTSGGGCYTSVPEVKEGGEWICKNNKRHETTYPLYWIFSKVSLTCINHTPAPRRGRVYTVLPLSVRPSVRPRYFSSHF
jgi:hypothetical protein